MLAGEKKADGARPPWGTRIFVGAFLAAFLFCGFAGVEAWPLTGWHLFSALRVPNNVGWRAVLVDARGQEQQFPLGSLPLAYRGAPLVIGRFDKLSSADQERLCETLIEGARSLHIDATLVRMYRVERDAAKRVGKRAAPEVLTLRYTCGDGSVRAAGP